MVIEKAEEMAMPFVTLANFGSIGTISDGTTTLAAAVDERFGPGKPGRVFVSGTSDDGGFDNVDLIIYLLKVCLFKSCLSCLT